MSNFNKEETKEFIRISCPMNLDGVAAKEFSDQSKSWLLSSVANIIIDFSGVASVTRDFYQAVLYLKSTLKKDNKILHSINVSMDIIRQIRSDGVEPAFNPRQSIDQILGRDKPAAGPSGKLDVAFINPFLVATQKTLEVQCKTKVKVLKPYIKKEQIPNIALAGVLTLISNGFTGSVVLCFSLPVFLNVYENMFGEKHTEISAELEDAAAELLNIIYGMAKIELNPKGYNFQLALPTILTAEKINIRQTGPQPAVIIPFETETGQLHLEIEFGKAQGGG